MKIIKRLLSRSASIAAITLLLTIGLAGAPLTRQAFADSPLLRGQVTDSVTGLPLPDIEVVVANVYDSGTPTGGAFAILTTDSNGNYVFEPAYGSVGQHFSLIAGEAEGQHYQISETNNLVFGTDSTVNVALDPAQASATWTGHIMVNSQLSSDYAGAQINVSKYDPTGQYPFNTETVYVQPDGSYNVQLIPGNYSFAMTCTPSNVNTNGFVCPDNIWSSQSKLQYLGYQSGSTAVSGVTAKDFNLPVTDSIFTIHFVDQYGNPVTEPITPDHSPSFYYNQITDSDPNLQIYVGGCVYKDCVAPVITNATFSFPSYSAFTSSLGTFQFHTADSSSGKVDIGQLPLNPDGSVTVVIPNAQSTPSDTTPPTVTGAPDRIANAAGWYKAPVTISWAATDPDPSSGSPTTPAPTTASLQGMHTYTSDQSCDPAGNCATGSLALSIDTVPPTGAFSGNALVVRLLGQTVQGTASDTTSGISQVTLKTGNTTLTSNPNGGLTLTCNAAKTSCTWKATASKLKPYIGNVTITVTDTAGNTSTTTKAYIIR